MGRELTQKWRSLLTISKNVDLLDFTRQPAPVAGPASLVKCRNNQRNAQVLDFISDSPVNMEGGCNQSPTERLPLLREIEAGKAAIAGCPAAAIRVATL